MKKTLPSLQHPGFACRRILLVILLVLIIIIAAFIWPLFLEARRPIRSSYFDGERALEDVYYQVSLGPRLPGSAPHQQAVAWMQDQLKRAGWQVEVWNAEAMGHPVQNVVARFGDGQPWIILGAHYDSRLQADKDPDLTKRSMPVPGANDGASGVAVLLELARCLPNRLEKQSTLTARQVWLVFFDAEDNGRLPGWDWLLGSRAFVASLTGKPDAVVIIDMIGDTDLAIYQERNSDPSLTADIWKAAARLGYQNIFIPQLKYTILDDHIPFIEAGIPAVDIIDFDYPVWHTTADTADRVSAHSLQIVGDVILEWLVR